MRWAMRSRRRSRTCRIRFRRETRGAGGLRYLCAPDGLRSRDFRLDRAVRTARLLYGRVCAIRLCAPNGIRTRVAALKGRNRRPLDDGGPVHAAPRPRPGGSAGKYSGRSDGPLNGFRRSGAGRPVVDRSHLRTRARAGCRAGEGEDGAVEAVERARTERSSSSRTAAIGNRIPNVWIDLVSSRNSASLAMRLERPSSPRIRSRRVSGTSARRIRPREPISRTSRMNETLAPPPDEPRWWAGRIRTRDTRVRR